MPCSKYWSADENNLTNNKSVATRRMGQINRTAVTFFLRLNSLLMANIRPEFHDGQVNDLQRSIQNGVGVSTGFLWRTSASHWVLYCVGKTSVTVFCFFDLEKTQKQQQQQQKTCKTAFLETEDTYNTERYRETSWETQCTYIYGYKDTRIFIPSWHSNVYRNLSWWHSIYRHDRTCNF